MHTIDRFDVHQCTTWQQTNKNKVTASTCIGHEQLQQQH